MIIKQLDAEDVRGGCEPDLVGFIKDHDVTRGRHIVARYTATVYRRPTAGKPQLLFTCRHEHENIAPAERCLRRLMRATKTSRAPR